MWCVWTGLLLIALVSLGAYAQRRERLGLVRERQGKQLLVGKKCKRTTGLVGEFYRRENLRAMKVRLRKTCAEPLVWLITEPTNKHDPLAIMGMFQEIHVGYLSREHARLYHEAVTLAERHDRIVACRGYMTADWNDVDQIVLYLPHPKTFLAEIQTVLSVTRSPESPNAPTRTS